MISQYLGSNVVKLSLTSGRELELTEDEIREISTENEETKNKILGLENDVAKYKDYYHRADSKLETNRETLRSLQKLIDDHDVDNIDGFKIISEILKIE